MTRDDRKLGFIGAGNMATALIKGILNSGVLKRGQLMASDRSDEALKRVSEGFGIITHRSNSMVASRCPDLVLAVKPQQMDEALAEMREAVTKRHLIISIAAGIPLARIEQGLGRKLPLIRVMPNTPALVQKGISALAPGNLATPQHMRRARTIFGAVGETVVVTEEEMDAVTALSGSGPGYVFRIMECMAAAGVGVGLTEDTARRLMLQTFLGSAYLAKESDESLYELRRQVTSPGGTTEAGLAVLESKGLEEMVKAAVKAAWLRSRELGKRLG